MDIKQITPIISSKKSPAELFNEYLASNFFQSLSNKIFAAVDNPEDEFLNSSSSSVFEHFLINEYATILSHKMPLVQTVMKDDFLNKVDVKA